MEGKLAGPSDLIVWIIRISINDIHTHASGAVFLGGGGGKWFLTWFWFSFLAKSVLDVRREEGFGLCSKKKGEGENAIVEV